MPSSLLKDSMAVEFGGQEPLPQKIILYQPYEVEQILLPDSANCLAVQAFLKMCGLEFQLELRSNAEYMSPSGRVPFIQCGTSPPIPEFDNIVKFIGTKRISLSDHLSPTSKADMRAYMSLVHNVFVNAELYICWIDEETLNEVTKLRHGSVYPWPLNLFLNWQKRKEVIKKLSVLGWYNKSIDDVCSEVKTCCTALSERLEGSKYFSGDQPNEVDALVFAHIFTLIKSNLRPTVQVIAETVKQFPKLIEHATKIDSNYFIRTPVEPDEDFEVIRSSSKDTLWNCSESLESLPPLSENSSEFCLSFCQEANKTPNELDALVFGHIFTIITTPLPGNKMANIVQSFPRLVELCKRIESRYFKRTED